jgi:hypothetical protein
VKGKPNLGVKLVGIPRDYVLTCSSLVRHLFALNLLENAAFGLDSRCKPAHAKVRVAVEDDSIAGFLAAVELKAEADRGLGNSNRSPHEIGAKSGNGIR